MSILRLLGLEPAEGSRDAGTEETETVRRITRALEALDPARARYIASFAFILSRVANADLEISEQETREMERIVREWGRLPEPQAILVVQIGDLGKAGIERQRDAERELKRATMQRFKGR